MPGDLWRRFAVPILPGGGIAGWRPAPQRILCGSIWPFSHTLSLRSSVTPKLEFCAMRRNNRKRPQISFGVDTVTPGPPILGVVTTTAPHRADYAFWQHIIQGMKLTSGRCAILFPPSAALYPQSPCIYTPGQPEPVAQELKIGITLPHDLMPRWWISRAPEVSTERGDKSYGLSELRGWATVFLLQQRSIPLARYPRTALRQVVADTPFRARSSA